MATSVVFGSTLFRLHRWPGARVDPAGDKATIGLVRVAAGVAAVSGFAWLVVMFANMTGGFADVADIDTLRVFFFETPFGPVSITRMLLLAALLVVASVPCRPGMRSWASVAIGGALLVDQAWFGHAAQGAGLLGAAMVLAYAVHVLAAAAWVGSLPALAVTLAGQRRRRGSAGAATYALLARYSAIAVAATSLIVASGIANTAFHLGGVAALWTTAYGGVLLAKLALVAAMLAIAAVNRFALMSRLTATTQPGEPLRHLRMSLALEMGLAVLVLGAVALLGVTPPPH